MGQTESVAAQNAALGIAHLQRGAQPRPGLQVALSHPPSPPGRGPRAESSRGVAPHRQGLLPSGRRVARAPDVIEEVPVRACVRRGQAVDLVLDRAREARSQIIFTTVKGREAIFWQSPKTTRQARPAVRVPARRASGARDIAIAVDTREHYPYRFSHQKASTYRRALPAGDYGVENEGELVAVVERKSLADLAARLVDGSLTYALAELATLERARARGRGPLRGGVQGTVCRSGIPRRPDRGSPDQVPPGADRLLRYPPPGRGVDLPLPRCRPRGLGRAITDWQLTQLTRVGSGLLAAGTRSKISALGPRRASLAGPRQVIAR